jgi:hypothetical protein
LFLASLTWSSDSWKWLSSTVFVRTSTKPRSSTFTCSTR